MIVRNCQFCFVEIDGPSAYQNRDGSILCKECFDAGRTPPRHEIKSQISDCCQCGEEFSAGLKFYDGTCICSECHKSNMLPVPNAALEPDNSHYTKGGIEPWTYIQANNLNFFEGSVVKYITRWRHKNGIEDLRKARVYIDELIRQEEDK